MNDRTLPKTTEKGNRPDRKKQEKKRDKTPPLLYGCRDAALVCGVNPKTWRTWNVLGYTPKPVVVGKTVFWRVDELEKWIDADCPSREEWTYRPKKDISKIFQKLCPLAERPG